MQVCYKSSMRKKSKAANQTRTDKNLNEVKRLRLPNIRSGLRGKVSEFPERDDNSRMNPGEKDCKNIGGQKIQTRVLHHYMFDLYSKYIAEYGRIMSKATFYRLRQKNILLAHNLCRKTCLCLKHKNFALKLHAGMKISTRTKKVILRICIQ